MVRVGIAAEKVDSHRNNLRIAAFIHWQMPMKVTKSFSSHRVAPLAK
jgi:hypothetical protein